jgi:hypothetical protein
MGLIQSSVLKVILEQDIPFVYHNLEWTPCGNIYISSSEENLDLNKKHGLFDRPMQILYLFQKLKRLYLRICNKCQNNPLMYHDICFTY